MERDKAISGTVSGGKKTAETNKRLYGVNYYSVLGKKGGKQSGKYKGRGGFTDTDLASRAGTIGGRNSHRRRASN